MSHAPSPIPSPPSNAQGYPKASRGRRWTLGNSLEIDEKSCEPVLVTTLWIVVPIGLLVAGFLLVP